MSEKIDLVNEVGLKTYSASVNMGNGQGFEALMVKESDVQNLLSKAVRVYGRDSIPETDELWTNGRFHGNKYSGLLINYKPIPKLEPVSAEEVIWALRNADQKGFVDNQYQKLVERLEKAGVAHGK